MCVRVRACRYDDSMVRFEAAAVKTQQSLSLLNLGQGVIFAAGTTAALAITGQQVRDGSRRRRATRSHLGASSTHTASGFALKPCCCC